MSKFTKYINCDNNGGLDTETILKSLFIQTGDGSVGIRTVIKAVGECDDAEQKVSCTNQMLTLDDLLRESIVLDACGEPALLLITTTNAT